MATAFGHEGATWHQRFRSLIGTMGDLVFPPVCASCQSVGELLCADCKRRISWVGELICNKCGRSQSTAVGVCWACYNNPLPLQQVRSATHYNGPVADTIKKFKYEGYFGLAKPLAGLMLTAWPRWPQPVDLVVPVPLHTARQRERGYNQAELLAQMMERELKWQVDSTVLKRVRRTRPQVGLNSTERQANVRGAFVTEPTLVAEKRILLIDDVHTTGATLGAAAEVLLAAGAKVVSAYCLASAADAKDPSQEAEMGLNIFDAV